MNFRSACVSRRSHRIWIIKDFSIKEQHHWKFLLIKSYQFQIRSLFLPFPWSATFYVLIMTRRVVCCCEFMRFRKVLDIELELMAVHCRRAATSIVRVDLKKKEPEPEALNDATDESKIQEPENKQLIWIFYSRRLSFCFQAIVFLVCSDYSFSDWLTDWRSLSIPVAHLHHKLRRFSVASSLCKVDQMKMKFRLRPSPCFNWISNSGPFIRLFFFFSLNQKQQQSGQRIRSRRNYPAVLDPLNDGALPIWIDSLGTRLLLPLRFVQELNRRNAYFFPVTSTLKCWWINSQEICI